MNKIEFSQTGIQTLVLTIQKNWAESQIRTVDPEITNHVLWPTELIRQVGKLTTSHRYNRLPLLSSDPGGVQQELVVQDLPGAKVEKNHFVPNKNMFPGSFFAVLCLVYW